MAHYDPTTFTWGSELEWGDIDRTLDIPPHLGEWDYSETDVLNLRHPYAGVAADPLGKDPPMGGEVKTAPSLCRLSQVANVLALKHFFSEAGCPPTVSCMQGLHIHVHVPGLVGDINALHRLTTYIKENQALFSEKVHGWYKDGRMIAGAIQTLRTSADLMPDWKCDNLLNAQDFEDFIRIQCCGKDATTRARPFRYAINTYNLKHIETIEFRAPRATLDEIQIRDAFEIVERFVVAALNGGPPLQEILREKTWNLATFQYYPAHFEAWKSTKHPKSRGKKERRFVPVADIK